MRTFVYVDGFNLYYGALKRSSWKWLDLPAPFNGTDQRWRSFSGTSQATRSGRP